MTKPSPIIYAVLPFALAGCFYATKSDVDKLSQDVLYARAGSNAADSVQRAYLIDLTRTVHSLSDSIGALSKRMNMMKTASDADIAAVKEDISQLQDLSGQSERQLRDMRAAVEQKTAQTDATSTPDSSARATLDAPAGGGPGPAQLLQAGRDQLLKGGNVAARGAFGELITKYPHSDLVPEAMFYTAQAYAAERNADAADKEYASLINRYPNSARVPTAMYKRALQMQTSKKTADAKRLFQEIIKRFPRSDEAALADERLQSIK
ncbi:MAG TPA: tetratricopeptide repeat protein [Gemmatimonadaceae bacterium]|nr:tetratricopeptide repeat protein [Gemmatimonadaceae bacterium]